MKIESTTNKPLVYRWPGGEVLLIPGQPVELPTERAARLLARAAGKVRVTPDRSHIDTTEDVVSPVMPMRGTIQAGDTITWDLSGLGTQEGVVDLVFSDPDGSLWGFVTLSDGSWAAVSLKIAIVIPGSLLREEGPKAER